MTENMPVLCLSIGLKKSAKDMDDRVGSDFQNNDNDQSW